MNRNTGGAVTANRRNGNEVSEKMEAKIKEVIEQKIRPALRMDGGDIEYIGVQEGIVEVRLTGACRGCPHAAMTLQHGVERMLKEGVPEIKGVKNVG